ncbi:MAG: hypothetical protein KDA96_02625, partial [Planctomycetaceae bacterium]|nr:hypothetical protein [Planctomycetaceae bacterium]
MPPSALAERLIFGSCTNMDVFVDDQRPWHGQSFTSAISECSPSALARKPSQRLTDAHFRPAAAVPQNSPGIALAVPLRANTFDALVSEVEQLEQQQIRHVSIRRQQILRFGEHTLQEVLENSGIRVACVGFIGGFTGALGVSYQQAVDDALRGIDLAADMNAASVVVVPGEQGLHTYRHAERTVRDALTLIAERIRIAPMRILVPTDTVLLSPRDCFRPRECPLSWITQLGQRTVRSMIVVRGRPDEWKLPFGWRECLDGGGFLRICHRCDQYQEN